MDKKAHVLSADEAKRLLLRSLRQQGFRLKGSRLIPPPTADKDSIRALHATAAGHKLERSKDSLHRHQTRLLERIADGSEVDPTKIAPRLVEVEAGSDDELLFRFASLHWSIPVSSGYGRRIRFLVEDTANGKLIGLVGLGDPVFTLADRDSWIGWDRTQRVDRLTNVMDAFVLGAVPPYSYLLCGKLVAALVASDEVRVRVRKKYSGFSSRISGRVHDGRLALVTTTSALGRSSIYNRITFGGRKLYHPVGYTRGTGEVHFSNGLYGTISAFAKEHTEPTWRNEAWGVGFRSRREVVKKTLGALGLSGDWVFHGVQREIYVVPMAKNTREFLLGQRERLRWYSQTVSELGEWFRERWILPRAGRDESYKAFDRATYKLWDE